RRHLDVLAMGELLDGIESRTPLPERPALITFDDGYRDNREIVLPILREAGVSACFFITTGFIGTPVIPWWDQVACCMKRARVDRFPSPFGGNDPPYVNTPARAAESARRFLRSLRRVPWDAAAGYLEALKAETRVDPASFRERPLFM